MERTGNQDGILTPQTRALRARSSMSHMIAGQPGRSLSEADLDQVQAETLIEHVELHEQITSTNDRALSLAGESAGLCPLLIVANRQTDGRGRGTNKWWASPGSLTFSLLLEAEKFRLSPSRWPLVSLNLGLSVCEAIEDVLGDHVGSLKWPNDVYLQNRKACGVLVEVPPKAPQMLVLGVGLNVNNAIEDAPSELAGSAIALRELAGQNLLLADVLTRVLARIFEGLSWVGTRDRELCRKWRARCMLTNRRVQVDLGERRIRGMCHGIDNEGALIVETESGIDRCFGGVVSLME